MAEFKECEACGVLIPATSISKYCENCKVNTRKVKREVEHAQKRAYTRDHENKDVTLCTCEICGKQYYSFDGNMNGSHCCSRECMQVIIMRARKCSICGKNLYSKGITKGAYCSPECEEAGKAETERLRIEKAKSEGAYLPCKTCGKMFISKNYRNQWCSQLCYKNYLAARKASEEAVIKQHKEIEDTCINCGKTFIRHPNLKQAFCCKECRLEYNKEQTRVKAKQKQVKAKQEQVKAKQEQVKAKPPLRNVPSTQPTGTEPTGQIINLCNSCKTLQRDCERFTSHFVYTPDGCKYTQVNNSIQIYSCPKYKG